MLAADAFGRTVANGWGTAGTGGPWTRFGPAGLFNVSGGTGNMVMNAGSGPRVALDGVSATSSEATVKLGLDKIGNGSGTFLSLGGRTDGNNGYRTKVKIAPTGRVTLYLVRVVNGGETTIDAVTLPVGVTYAVGEQLQVRMRTEGTSPTTVRARAWEVGTSEPSGWQVSGTDNTGSLQSAAGVSLVTYLSGSSGNAPVVAEFDDLSVTPLP